MTSKIYFLLNESTKRFGSFYISEELSNWDCNFPNEIFNDPLNKTIEVQ